MKKIKKILFIYNDLHFIESLIILAQHYGIQILFFSYPEDFEEANPNVEGVDLIVLGHYFPGDGRETIQSGYFRGLSYYKTLLQNEKLKDVKIIIPCTMLRLREEYEKELLRNEVSLKEGDEFIGVEEFGTKFQELLKESNRL